MQSLFQPLPQFSKFHFTQKNILQKQIHKSSAPFQQSWPRICWQISDRPAWTSGNCFSRYAKMSQFINSVFFCYSEIWKKNITVVFWFPKHDLRCAAATCGGPICGSRLRCACGTHFGSNLRCACMQCSAFLRLAKCDHNIAHNFGNYERVWLSFGLSYDFVAQKWSILAFS